MTNVLVIYAYHRFPVRKALWNHLYCFGNNPRCRAYFINLRYRSIPDWLTRLDFDAVIFDTTFAGQRWGREQFRKVMKKAGPVKRINAPKYLIPQDEFLNTDLLCEFVEDFSIDRIYTVLPESGWEEAYGPVYPGKTDIRQVLTGYLDDGQLAAIDNLAKDSGPRKLDIVYRAASQPWFGRHGMQKSWIADVVKRRADARGMRTDISGEQKTESDRLHGDDWFRFLLNGRYTIGVDGGTSIHDRDGTIRESSERYMALHPDAPFEDVEAACFPGKDGRCAFVMLSPRHLEACATRTCQILMEGHYNGVLEPGMHYIELKADYSNLDEVLDLVESGEGRERIVEQAYSDIVASGRYSYQVFVDTVLEDVKAKDGIGMFGRLVIHPYMCLRDRLSWLTVWFVDTFFKPKH